MKQFMDFEDLINKQSEVIHHTLCDHISNVTSDIIAILASSFVDDNTSFEFEKEALGEFNEESEMIQHIVGKKDGQAYDMQIQNLLQLTKYSKSVKENPADPPKSTRGGM